MDKIILNSLKPLVNNNRQWASFSNYIDAMIEQHHRSMEQQENTTLIYRTQGSILALKRLKMLREEVNVDDGI
jgi:hypothetical protein